MKELNPAIQWWVGNKLPKEHIFPPEGVSENAIQGIKRWTVQPAKRHAAHLYSEFLSNRGCEIIGITGSAGKTTIKEMLAAVLSQRFKTVWTPENIDPVYNIPNTLLKTTPDVEKLVLEMGIEFPGEMDFYLWLAQPSTGVLTNIYWTHTQFFGDKFGVQKEKGKLIESLPKDGYAILNYDDPLVAELAERTQANVITYGTSHKASIRAKGIKITDDYKTRFSLVNDNKQIDIELPLLGKHFVSLALAACAVGLLNDMKLEDIRNGLSQLERQPHRMVPIELADGSLLVDDAYNANPLATIEALKTLNDIDKDRRKIFVFGEMKELGDYEEEGHREVGQYAGEADIDYIISLGEATKNTLDQARKNGIKRDNLKLAKDKNDVLHLLDDIREPGDIILIKGSRSMKMEELVESLTS